MDPEMKQAEAKAAAEIGQSKASLKNPGGQS